MCPARGEKNKNNNGQLGINNVTPWTVICVRLKFYADKNSFMGGGGGWILFYSRFFFFSQDI